MAPLARKIAMVLADACLILFGLFLALMIRFNDGLGPGEVWEVYRPLILPVTFIRLPVFYFFGLYSWSFRYASRNEALRVFAAVSTSTFALIVFVAFFYFHEFRTTIGRSVLLIDYLICLFLIMVFRFSFRDMENIIKGFQEKFKRPDLRRVLILGADDLGELLAREFLRRPELGYCPVGFLDKNPQKTGIRIHGIKVCGEISHLADWIREKKTDEVIIALSEASGEDIKAITKVCRQLGTACRIVPHIASLVAPQLLPLKLRDVDASDLLGREIVQVDLGKIRDFFRNKTVLITGAGGSIGSEIVKILFQASPRELVLVDNCESNLYDIQLEFGENHSETKITSYLCDVTHRQELEKIFKRHQPQIVYHGAAYKHVPLLEHYFVQGILNNILGTKVTADLALRYAAERFVFISSDKAIRPTSLMGATKRIAELYTQSLGGSDTRFMSVRFGNVLNSKGSVIPLFKKQLEAGTALTVTDPEVKRYFMDVSEAVCLILQATLLGSNSEIFVLDMGRPIKIVDLARDLGQLMGLRPEEVPIKFIGLRPGEKLEEEIELETEQALPTPYKKIKIWKVLKNPDSSIAREIEGLFNLINLGASREEVIQKMKAMVPEYQPWFPKETTAALYPEIPRPAKALNVI